MARATYREILERRAKENSVDFVEGVATAITPLAVLETVMVKGYQTLVDEGTSVSYRDAVEAALKLCTTKHQPPNCIRCTPIAQGIRAERERAANLERKA